MHIPLVDLSSPYQTIKHEIPAALEDGLENMQLFLGPHVKAFECEEVKPPFGSRSQAFFAETAFPSRSLAIDNTFATSTPRTVRYMVGFY